MVVLDYSGWCMVVGVWPLGLGFLSMDFPLGLGFFSMDFLEAVMLIF